MENNESVTCCYANKNINFSRANHTRLIVCPTTGGKLELCVSATETVHGLKYFISRKLKLQQDCIKLLYRNRLLNHGTLRENNVTDNSKITLIPHLETGLSLQKKDSNVLKALESLTESQVNDFLSGRAPLVLGMRIADHIVFIQLQLSTSQSKRHHRPPPVRVPTSPISKDHQEVPSPTPTPDHSNFSHYTQYGNCFQKTSDYSSTPPPQNSGAVIHRMQHLGQGIYSGTFSGSLDQAVQDREGHPRRNINTIAHILNDLLGAQPQIDIARAGTLRQQLNTATSNTQETVQPDTNKDMREDPVLREKVEQLQRMMEDRKKRRQTRRQTIAPYLIDSRHQENTESMCDTQDILTPKESESLAV